MRAAVGGPQAAVSTRTPLAPSTARGRAHRPRGAGRSSVCAACSATDAGGEDAGAGASDAPGADVASEWKAFASSREEDMQVLRGSLDTDLIEGRRFDKGYQNGIREEDLQRALELARRAREGDPSAAGQPTSVSDGRSVYAMLLHDDVVASERRYSANSSNAQEEAQVAARETQRVARLAGYGAIACSVLSLWHPLGAAQGLATAAGAVALGRVAAAPMLEQMGMLFTIAANRGGARPSDEAPPRYRR